MIIGSVILIFVHGMAHNSFLNAWWLAAALVIILGIGFSVGSGSYVANLFQKLFLKKQLGTAYAVIFWIQNIGLWIIPLLLGIILNSNKS